MKDKQTTMARHTGSARRAGEAGYSLMEVMISMVLVVILVYLVTTLSIAGMSAQKYTDRMSRVTEIAQDVVDDIRTGMRSSVHLFSNDVRGLSYRALVDVTGFATPLAATLPRIAVDERFEPDDGVLDKTGNELFFARHAWTDEFLCTSGNTYRVDVYRLELYYLTEDGAGPGFGSSIGLNFAHWVSEPIADGSQVDSITDPTDQAEFLLHLLSQTVDVSGNKHAATELVWKVGADLALTDTLRQIDSTGLLSLTPISPRSGWSILREPGRSIPGLLFYRHHSIASNFAPDIMGVGRFGTKVNTGAGFPHGFEIQIIGPAAAREVLIHMSFASTNRSGRTAFHEIQMVSLSRDL